MFRTMKSLVVCCAAMLTACCVAAAESGPRPLDEILKQKVDVKFHRHYLPEVLDTLGAQTGLRSAYPATLDTHLAVTFEGKGMPVGQVLAAMTAACRYQFDFRSDRVLVWDRVDDKLFEDTVKNLHDADRWKRCEAAYELGRMADPRIYEPLMSALKDSNPQVVGWALDALSKHADVLAFVELKDREALVKTIQAELARPVTSSDPSMYYNAASAGLTLTQLLGAANTPSSVEILKGFLKDDSKRYAGLCGLSYSRQAAATDLILNEARSADPTKTFGVTEALRRLDTAASAEVLIRMAKTPLPPTKEGKKTAGNAVFGAVNPGANIQYMKASAWRALSTMHEPAAQQAVLSFLKSHDELAALGEQLYAIPSRAPQAADALAALLNDGDEHIKTFAINSLAQIGDARALEPVLQRINAPAKDDRPGMPRIGGGLDLHSLCSIRDERAETALIRLCKNPPARPENQQMYGAREPEWLSAMIFSRDTEVPESFMEMMKEPKADPLEWTRLATTLVQNLRDPKETEKLNELLLASDGAALRDLVLQTSSSSGGSGAFYDWTSFNVKHSFFATDPRWIKVLSDMIEQPFVKGNGGGGSMSNGWLTTTFPEKGRIKLISGNPAIAALLQIGSPVAVRAVLSVYSSANDEIRKSAVAAGAQFPEAAQRDPERIEALAARLNDTVGEVKTSAIRQLAALGDKRAIGPLKETIKNPPQLEGNNLVNNTTRVRWDAAQLLLQAGDAEARDLIVSLAEDESANYSDSDVRYLGNIKTPLAAEVLRAIMKDEKVPADRREQAASALYAASKDKEAREVLFEILKTPFREGIKNGQHLGATDWNSHQRIIQSLQQEKDPAITVSLIELVTDTNLDEKLRSFTLERMSASGMDDASLAKIKALCMSDDAPLDVRVRAASMLCGRANVYGAVKLETPPPADVLKTLIALYKEKPLSTESSQLACNVLAGIDDPAAQQALVDNFKSEVIQKKLQAAAAVAQVRNDPAAIDVMLDIVKNGQGQQQQQAHSQLQGILMDWNKTVPQAIKDKIKNAFDEINKSAEKPQKPPAPPADF